MSKILKGLSESTHNKYANNRTGFSRGPRDDERHDLDAPKPAREEWALKINGKVWSKDGKTVTFASKEQALKARQSLLSKRPELEVGLVSRSVSEEQLDELSNNKLNQYKTAASTDASKADSEGDYNRANKRFSGIVKATKKQFNNDTKKSSMDEADENPPDPFKHVNPRVNNPKILGTQNRAKSAYYPPSKPPVKKLDKPLPESLGDELTSKSIQALQQVKQQLEQQRMAELEQWEKDFKQNTVSKFTAREPNLRQRATSTSMVAMPGEKHSELKTRLGQLNKAIEKQGILDNLVQRLDKKGLMTPNIEAGVDTSMLVRDGARDNYVSLNDKLDKAVKYVTNRLMTNKAAYAKPKAIDEDDMNRRGFLKGLGAAAVAGAAGGAVAQSPEEFEQAQRNTWAQRVGNRIKANTTFNLDNLEGNPQTVVEIRIAANGTILSRKILSSSGNKAWDEAVLRAIDKTATVPLDSEGKIPSTLIRFSHRPNSVPQQNAEPKESDNQGVAEEKQRLDPKCWKGYKKQGTKMKGDTRVNNCVPVKESSILQGLKKV